MKKLLTLILCWLLAFSAMAENTFKAYSSASVAGGYITSLNKVDGSFEDVTSQWVASVGTIVKTASTEMQGNNIGVWSGTGTGTLDLQWTATSSNTYEASAQVDVQGEGDVYVCAYVGTTETGCKLIPALSKIQKVSVVADSVMSSAFYLRLKHTGSDAFSVKVDDGKIEPWTPQAVNLVEQESVEAYGNGGTSLTSAVTDVPFTTLYKSTLSKLGTWTNNTTYTASKKQIVTITGMVMTNSVSIILAIYKNGLSAGFIGEYTGGTQHTVNATLELNAGEYITIRATSNNATLQNGIVHRIQITASAISENVVQSYAPSDFLGEIKLLPTTTAPRGFIPADGKSIGKTSGNYQGDAYYALYALRWTMASTTAGEPYVISSAKGASAQADWDAGKTITIDVRGMFFRAAGGNAGTVGSKQSDAFQGHGHGLYSDVYGNYPIASNMSSVTGNSFGFLDTSGTSVPNGNFTAKGYVDVGYSTPRFDYETRPINTSEYAYMRYGTSAPDLIALPTSKSPSESATFSNAGTIAISSISSDWITSISRSGMGTGSIDYSKLSLTKPPALFGTDLTGNGRVVSFSSITTTSATWKTESNAGSAADGAFSIKLEKQSPDYTAPGVFVGSLAKNQVAYIKDVKANGTNGGSTTAGSWLQRDINTIEGDSSIVSVSSNAFTLQAGDYDIEIESPAYTTGYHRIGLALSGSSTPDIALGTSEWSGSAGSYATTKSRIVSRITISAATTYKILHRTGVSVVGNGFGAAVGFGVNEVYTQVKITKLNGQ